MNWKQRGSWHDIALLGLTFGWIGIGGGLTTLHLFTVGMMGLILSLGLTRGLWAALSRTAVVSAIILFAEGWKGQSHPAHLANMASMMACAVIAGVLGDRQRRAQEALKRSFAETLNGLAEALEAKDAYTEGHTRRTADIAVSIAREMGLDPPSQRAIESAGILHDLGKIGTPDAILHKNGTLTPEEKRQMQEHPVIGHKILRGISFLEDAALLVRHHHEHYDGSGYPDGLSGSAIPLGARILTVADAFDALTSDRPYHQGISQKEAIRKLEDEAGRQFDPTVLEVLSQIDFAKLVAGK